MQMYTLPIIHEKERFVQRQMETTADFVVHMHSVQDVETFVKLATAQSFRIYLDDGSHRVNGKSFMEMFCLTLTTPLHVIADCSPDALRAFLSEVAQSLDVEEC